jgi:phosphate transport system permease protein
VLGYFALVLISPMVRWFFEDAQVFNALSASIAVAVMIIPTVISLSEDVLRSVPKSLREAAYALGSTKFEVVTRVVVPAAMSGIVAAVILAISRAVGETMAVRIAAGSNPKLTLNPLDSIETMTGFIARISQGDTPVESIEFKSIFAVCTMLFLMTLGMNLLARWILSRYRERYE